MSATPSPHSDAGQFRIEEIGLNSPLLEAVIKLHAAGKSRLGPFPRGAFEDHAQRNLILAALAADGSVAGYLLYRIAKNRATIVHLTTNRNHRNKGVARLLVDRLKEKTKHLLGISLRCRRDYHINDLWQGLGFTVRHSKEGRGVDGALLDYWWFDHNHDDLFSQAAAREDVSDLVLTAMDANVFYDLIQDGRPHSEDTRVLQADWLQDSIVLCVTQEMYNEIHRSPNENEKRRCRMAAQSFRELKTDETRVRALELELAPLFRGGTLDHDISDMRHIAHAIAAEVPFFVTRDSPMLDRSDSILEKYGLHILHPTDLVNRFDVLRREAEYRPARLEGSNWRERLVVSEDVENLVSVFKHKSHERSGNFEQRIRHYLVNPNEWTSSVIADANKSPIIYLVRLQIGLPRAEIAFLRHAEHPLAGTLLRHLAHEISREANGAKHKVIVVSDPELSDETRAALSELAFLHDTNAWWKISLAGLVSKDELVTEIRNADVPASLKERLVGAVYVTPNTNDEAVAARLESLFSPGKLVSSAAPCYVVSIRQSWAAHFFDILSAGKRSWI